MTSDPAIRIRFHLKKGAPTAHLYTQTEMVLTPLRGGKPRRRYAGHALCGNLSGSVTDARPYGSIEFCESCDEAAARYGLRWPEGVV